MNWGIADLQSAALPLGYGAIEDLRARGPQVYEIGAGDEARTRYLHLGKVALYRMSYARINKWYLTTKTVFVKMLFHFFPKLALLFLLCYNQTL